MAPQGQAAPPNGGGRSSAARVVCWKGASCLPFNLYDLLVEPFVRPIRRVGLALYTPPAGARILDVGCGTGTTLQLYAQASCHLSGLDATPQMVAAARAKLGPAADLRLGDAAQMPYPDGSFDLVTATLALHEMRPAVRAAAAAEIARVLKPDGRAVLIDFRPAPHRSLLAWLYRAVILFFETLAGREHFRNGREFVRSGGLPALFAGHGLAQEEVHTQAGGHVGVYLFSHA